MSLFNIETAKQNAIIAQPHVKEVEKIFDKYVRTTLEKIEISISDSTSSKVSINNSTYSSIAVIRSTTRGQT